ncbi:MAG TPA: hypothetical protein VN538_12690 [Clostridia bacterium]|nr:hypothetical protein [Clostridia bacterium]
MAWQNPKTNWEVKPLVGGIYQGDWFNFSDYNRIAGNLYHLHTLGQNVLGIVFSISSMPTAVLNAFPRASDINLLEDNLYAITQNVYSPPAYTGKKTWLGNAATPTFADLNRIESACDAIFAHLYSLIEEQVFAPSGADELLTSAGETFLVIEEV